MKKPFFSIVIPVYNAELYIEPVVKSVRQQTCQDLELILVDDASTDGSRQICEDLGADFSFKLLKLKQNCGLANARNLGLRHADGEYVLFVDADDYLDPDLLTRAQKLLQQNAGDRIDILVFGFYEEYFDRHQVLFSKKKILPSATKIIDRQLEVRKAVLQLQQEGLFGYAWNKIYSRTYLEQQKLEFALVPMIEDLDFNRRAMAAAKNLALLSWIGYHYARRYRTVSLYNAYVPDYFELYMGYFAAVCQQYQNWGLEAEAQPYLLKEFVRYTFYLLQMTYDPRWQQREKCQQEMLDAVYGHPFYQKLCLSDAVLPWTYRILGQVLQTQNKWLVLMVGRLLYFFKNQHSSIWNQLKCAW